MRLTILGCSGSFAGPESPASGYLVQAQGPDPAVPGRERTWNLLLDLGSGAFGALQRHLAPHLLDAVCLTHLHPDHAADMAGLHVYVKYRPAQPPAAGAAGADQGGPGLRLAPPVLQAVPAGGGASDAGRAAGRPSPVRAVPDQGSVVDLGVSGPGLRVLGPASTEAYLETVGGPGGPHRVRPEFRVEEFQDAEPCRIGPFIVTPFQVEHAGMAAFGLRVAGPSEAHTGTAVLGFTGDGDECAGFDNLAAGADLLLAEAAFMEGRDEARGVHLTGRRAGALARRAGVARLVLTHIPPWNDVPAEAADARAAFPGGQVDVARSDRVYVL